MVEVASDELLGLVCFNHSAIFAFGDLSFNLGVAAHFLDDFLRGVDLLEVAASEHLLELCLFLL